MVISKLNKNFQKEELKKDFHIDHITPLACGGSNEAENLQILCKPCHFDKTRQEQNDNYVNRQTQNREVFMKELNIKSYLPNLFEKYLK